MNPTKTMRMHPGDFSSMRATSRHNIIIIFPNLTRTFGQSLYDVVKNYIFYIVRIYGVKQNKIKQHVFIILQKNSYTAILLVRINFAILFYFDHNFILSWIYWLKMNIKEKEIPKISKTSFLPTRQDEH